MSKIVIIVSENNVQDGKVSYKSIGSFKTRREAEYALEVYHENPIDYSQTRSLVILRMR